MTSALTMDSTRATLPGAAVSVTTAWAQAALRASGASIAVDGRAGPATLAALESFRAAHAPDDTIRPSGEATSPDDRYPSRVIIGQKTERVLAQFAPSASPRPQTIGPHLDPTAPLAPSSSGSSTWMWVLGGAALAAALAGSAWYFMRGGSSAPRNRKVPYKRAKARRAPRNRRRR